jgi:tetratricopeptide (TPR) repeat protein
VSAPGAQPNAKSGIRVLNMEKPLDIVLLPGDGKRLTFEEAKAVNAGGGSSSDASGSDKARAAEIAKKNEELKAANEKVTNSNKIIGDAFTNGNAALKTKNYDEAIKQYDTGISADPEHPGVPSLLTNKSVALRMRAVDRYNAAIKMKADDAAKNPAMESARADFKASADAASQAVEQLNKLTPPTDPNDLKQQATNKYFALSARAEAMRLYVAKGDPSKVDDGVTAYREYIAAEPDAAKKSQAQMELAMMLLDIGAGDKAFAEFQKILAEKPDDPEANRGAGLALFSTGDKTKYQEAANYLQRYVDKAADSPDKQSAKEALDYLKTSENVVPEKTSTPPRRKRP